MRSDPPADQSPRSHTLMAFNKNSNNASIIISNSVVCGPVEERDRQTLETNEQTIVKLMDPDRISRLLIDKGVIDTNDRKQILVPPASCDRNRMLLAKLLTRGSEAFQNYMHALDESRTKNHTKLARILRNEEPRPAPAPAPDPSPVEEKGSTVRHRRISEKIDNHERRLQQLEDGVLQEGRQGERVASERADSIRAELARRSAELDELRQLLKTREGELQDSREENKALQRRILSLEKKIVSLETYLKEQKTKVKALTKAQQQDTTSPQWLEDRIRARMHHKVEALTKQQQQDKKSLRSLEDRNSRLEARLESAEKKMEKKLQDQEKRHLKELEEIRHMIRDSAKHSADGKSGHASSTSSSSKQSGKHASSFNSKSKTAGNTRQSTAPKGGTTKAPEKPRTAPSESAEKTAAGRTTPVVAVMTVSQTKTNITPKNRFESQQPASSQTKFFRAPRVVQSWKKSTEDPDKSGGKG